KANIGPFTLQSLGTEGQQDFLITLGKVTTDEPGKPVVSPAPPAPGAVGGTAPAAGGNAGAPAAASPTVAAPGAAGTPAAAAPGPAGSAARPAPGEESGGMQSRAEGLAQHVEQVIKTRFPTVTLRRVESVGPKVGRELRMAAVWSILFALGAILVYIWVRFQWRYSLGAIVATVHDVLIVLTAFVLTQREFTLTVLAAVLTIAGYSVNDTVVVFDRIRENQRRQAKKDMALVMNESINQTLSRTLLTSGLTMTVVVVMYFFGGEIINDFAFAMLVGVLIGTYSSIFSASPVVYMLYKRFPPVIK
ncbi:MAG TPA: protein translocase subunit SecF, partial [bacterium]|nr:protein translocase subunit SecF [bacterium]